MRIDIRDYIPQNKRTDSVIENKICKACGNVLGIAEFKSARGSSTYSKCPSCRKAENHREYKRKVRLSTKDIKIKLLEIFGNKCSVCGYNDYLSALEFHHRDKNSKDSQISQIASQYCSSPKDHTWERLIAEASKCDVLCSNCHQALHAGYW